VLKIVAEIGINGVTVRAVANEAGWSPGIITHYFGNRREMLLGGLRRAAAVTGGRQHKLLENATNDPVGSLEQILESILPLDAPRLALSRVFLFFYAEAAADDAAKDAVSGALARWRAAVAEVFRLGQEQGVFDSRVAAKTAADDLVGLVDGLAIHALFDPALLHRLRERSPAGEWLAHYTTEAKSGGAGRSRARRKPAAASSARAR